MSAPFEPGELALLFDERGRTYLIRLAPGGTFHFHGGAVPHGLILGAPEGTVVHSTIGAALSVFRPRLSDFILKMPRGAQVVYPKDLGAILVYADVFPGARVLEAGTGSGALTLALCRTTGPEGRVVSYEIRADFHRRAAQNVESFLGKLPAWLDLREGDVRQVAETGERFHRAIVDLPEPWGVLEEVGGALLPGGILCAYLPTTGQVQALALSLPGHGFRPPDVFEILLRPWHVTERSVRPEHRMVAHTGFLVVARRQGPAA